MYGSTDLFLYDVNEVITQWDFTNQSLVWVRRQSCMTSLGVTSSDAFLDACLLSGSEVSSVLPQLETRQYRQQPKIQSAAEAVMSIGKGNGNIVCLQYANEAANKGMQYTELFQKARMSVRHHVVLTKEGKAEPLNKDHAPGKIHEFIGQRLPDELYFYFSKGIIGPRVLNWRTTADLPELPPLDGGESKEYRDLSTLR